MGLVGQGPDPAAWGCSPDPDMPGEGKGEVGWGREQPGPNWGTWGGMQQPSSRCAGLREEQGAAWPKLNVWGSDPALILLHSSDPGRAGPGHTEILPLPPNKFLTHGPNAMAPWA